MLRRFTALAALVPDGLLLVSREGRIVAASEPAAARLGVITSELVGSLLAEHLATPAEEVAAFLARCRRSTSPIPGVLVSRDAAASRVRCEGARLPDELTEGDGVVALRWCPSQDRFVMLTRNIDELNVEILQRKRAEAEREALIAKLEASVRLSELFMGILGHDLRNPLAAVTTAAQLALRAAPQEDVRRQLERIVGSAGRMGRMIDQLLDVTRIRLGQGLPVRRATMDLAALAGQTLAEFELSHADHAFTLTVHGETSGAWDHDRLAQVLSNLLGNAVQHGARGAPVAVAIDGRAHEAVRLQVRNQGTPIDPERLASLFDPFRTGDRSRGLGLGLYITREIVVAHGGAIDVASDASGTTFTVTLPRCASDAAPRAA